MLPSVPQPGDLVAGKYELASLLGKGGMGVVALATHKRLGTRVAIKFLMPDALGSHDGVARFDREARASALLRSPYVVRVLDIDATTEGLPFIVMEYLDGHDLGSEIRRRKTIPLAEAVDWMLQACIGLSEAHARGIVHRDIKPANLFLCMEASGPIVKVMDFGVSKLTAQGEVDLTTTETTIGTPNYMAPEQLLSSKSIDHRADVWALGVVLYRMLAGALPFSGATPTALAIAIATAPPVHLASVAPGLPPAVVAAVMRALEKDPANRHSDMVAFGRALEPFGTRRVAFGAAVAGMPAPRAAIASSPDLAAAAGSADRTATMKSPMIADDMSAGTEKPWTQRALAPLPSARKTSTPALVALLGSLAVLAMAGIIALLFTFLRREASPAAVPAASTDLSTTAGAFALPPPTPEPPSGAMNEPLVAPSTSAASPATSASHGARHLPPGKGGNGTAPSSAAATGASPGKPAAGVDAGDPLHL